MKTITLRRDSFDKAFCREDKNNLGSSNPPMVIQPQPNNKGLDKDDIIEVKEEIRCYKGEFETVTDLVTYYKVEEYDDYFLQIVKQRAVIKGKEENYTTLIR